MRLLFRDLAAAAALVSMAVSGEVPAWALGCFGVGLVLALLGRRLFAGRGTLGALLLGLCALGLYGGVATLRLDLVVAACTFAGLLTLVLMLSAPSPRTDGQVLLTSTLMVAGGAALSGELLFAPALVAFAVLALLCQGLGTVEAAGEREAPLPRGAVRPLVLCALGTVALGALLFVLFPRLSWNVAGRRRGLSLGRAESGMGEHVRLGGAGVIKTNPRVVFRATLTPDPGVAALGGYWVAETFDTFDGVEWSGAGSARPAQEQVTLGPGGGALTLQRIELLPSYGSRVLVALEEPLRFGSAVQHQADGDARGRLVPVPGTEVRLEMDAPSTTYHAYSRLGAARQKGAGPRELTRALALPGRLDPRIPALAAGLVGTQQDPLAAAHALEHYLQGHYAYTLELPGPAADPLADFLFRRKAGHCEDFATALAVLLRTQGIPARVVTGFYGGKRAAGAYLVRAGDAHAWTEAFIDGRGFVRLDATPEASRGADANRLLSWLLERYEALEMGWQSSVVDYSFRSQADLAERLLGPGRSGPGRLPAPSRQGLAALGAAAVLLVTVGAWRRRTLRPSKQQVATAAALAGLRRALEHAVGPRRTRLPTEGLEALLQEQAAQEPERAAVLHGASACYLAARFGERPAGAQELRRWVGALRKL